MLWKRRWLALTIWVLASIVSIFVVRALPSVYRSEAVVLVDSQKIPEAFVSPTVSGDVADRLALITQNIMTSIRLLKIIHAFDLYRDERRHLTPEELLGKMRQDISVSFEKSWTGDRMHAFRIGYQGQDAKIVAEVTNRLAGLYVEENLRTREDQAKGTVDFLSRQLKEAKVSLDEQEQKVAEFKQRHNGTLPEQEHSLLGTLNSLSVELQGIHASIARTQESKLSLEAALSAAESSEASLRTSLLRRSSVAGQIVADSDGVLNSKSDILREKLRELRLRYTPDHPDVQEVEKDLVQAEQEEAEASRKQASKSDGHGGLKGSGTSDNRLIFVSPELVQTREKIATLRGQIEAADYQMKSLEKQRQQLLTAISDCQARINKLPLVEQEMVSLKRNYEESANNYNSLLQKKLAAGIATDMERSQKSERFTVVDAARIPQKPVKPKRILLSMGGSVAGLIIGLLVGCVLEFRKHTLLGEWELPEGTVVLGRVPLIEMATSSVE